MPLHTSTSSSSCSLPRQLSNFFVQEDLESDWTIFWITLVKFGASDSAKQLQSPVSWCERWPQLLWSAKHLFNRDGLFFCFFLSGGRRGVAYPSWIAKMTFISTRSCSSRIRSHPNHRLPTAISHVNVVVTVIIIVITAIRSATCFATRLFQASEWSANCLCLVMPVCSEQPELNPRVSERQCVSGRNQSETTQEEKVTRAIGLSANQTLLWLMSVILAHLHYLKTGRKTNKLFCCKDAISVKCKCFFSTVLFS